MEQALVIYLHPEGLHCVPPDTPLSSMRSVGRFPEHDMEVFKPLPEITKYGGHVTFPIKNLHTFVPPEWIQPHIEHVWYYAHRRNNRTDPYFNHSLKIGETHASRFDPQRSSYLGGTSLRLLTSAMMSADGWDIDYHFLNIDITTPTIAEAAAWLKRIEHVQHPSELPPGFAYLGDYGKRLSL